MTKVIVFDFGGVLGPDADDWTGTFKEILKLTGLSQARMQEMFNTYWPKLKVGQESMKNFWNFVALNSEKKIGPEKLRRTYNNSVFLDKKILKLINELKKKYRVVLLANDSDDDYLTKVNKLKLNKIFNKIYSSSNLGMAKPDKKIFKFVLKDLGVPPVKLVFIDNQEDNYKTSKLLGINSILFKGITDLEAKLRKIL